MNDEQAQRSMECLNGNRSGDVLLLECSLDENSVEFLENNSDSKRKLAYVTVISEIQPIESADSIELAKVNGYQAVIRKDEFNVGDEVIYVESGVILPENRPEYAFMEKNNFCLKTIRLKKVYSQGLITPLSSLTMVEQCQLSAYDTEKGINGSGLGIGTDLTEILGIKVIPEKPLSSGSANMGRPKGAFPSFLRKTDESRLSGMQPEKYLKFIIGRRFAPVSKLDGSSVPCTYIKLKLVVNLVFALVTLNLRKMAVEYSGISLNLKILKLN